jgi:hypothetical protein
VKLQKEQKKREGASEKFSRLASLLPAMVRTGILVLLGMWGYEILQVSLFPQIDLWQSVCVTMILTALIATLVIFSCKRKVQSLYQEKLAEQTLRLQAEKERSALQQELEMMKIKIPHGFLTFCAHCKNIRDKKNWVPPESYLSRYSSAEFSPSLCPHCAQRIYPHLFKREFKPHIPPPDSQMPPCN